MNSFLMSIRTIKKI